jgi:hypothetical protein
MNKGSVKCFSFIRLYIFRCNLTYQLHTAGYQTTWCYIRRDCNLTVQSIPDHPFFCPSQQPKFLQSGSLCNCSTVHGKCLLLFPLEVAPQAQSFRNKIQSITEDKNYNEACSITYRGMRYILSHKYDPSHLLTHGTSACLSWNAIKHLPSTWSHVLVMGCLLLCSQSNWGIFSSVEYETTKYSHKTHLGLCVKCCYVCPNMTDLQSNFCSYCLIMLKLCKQNSTNIS